MIIDTHCHIDLYNNPHTILKECANNNVTVIAVTNLPSHFEMGYQHILPYSKIRLALGMHPLFAEQHGKEFPIFFRNLSKTSYIGEVGLDFSKEGYSTKDIQIQSFKKILSSLSGKKKILSLHSRRAEKEVLAFLISNRVDNAIFHWYSGSLSLIKSIVEAGYYFSINPAMTTSPNGQKIINQIPENRILTESDGPYIEYEGRQITPLDIKSVELYLATIWHKTPKQVNEIIKSNFGTLINNIK